jgi:hypothetical protein
MRTLIEIFPNDWASDQPKSLVELMEANYEDLDPKARKLRDMAVKLVHLFERKPVLNAQIAFNLVESHHLPVRLGRWTAIALNGDRERIYVRGTGSSMRMLHSVSANFPTITKLEELASLPNNGVYLLLFGGGLDSMTETNLQGLEKLSKATHVEDVIFWDETATSATFWSIKAGVGQCGINSIDFPDKTFLERWQELCS